MLEVRSKRRLHQASTGSLKDDIYYKNILKNPIATMVKLLDRCNNVSGMAAAFNKEKLIDYIKETEKIQLQKLIRQKWR